MFIYILAIIIFSLVLLFGYKAIKDLISKSETVDYIHFRTKLISTVKRVDYGDVIEEDFTIPKGYNEVCFIDLEESGSTPNIIIDDSWNDNVKVNVFLVAPGGDVDSFYVENLRGADKDNPTTIFYDCISIAQGRIKARFEGMGGHARVSQAS